MNTIQKMILIELGVLIIFWIFFSQEALAWMNANAVVNPYPYEINTLNTFSLIVASIMLPFLTLFAFKDELKEKVN